jgi:endo-1,4-beta-D-glucanase Y
MKKKIFGAVLILLACVIVMVVLYKNSQKSRIPIVFSPTTMINGLWENYKIDYWDQNTGRTFDKQRNDITTSEGQSYAMLRAVWQDDKTTFDKTWQWTKLNLKRQNDSLFSWQYGTTSNGSLGVMTENGGENSASDADTDIAVSLIFASARWNEPNYLNEARTVIQDIWNNEVITISGKPYLTANNLEKNSPQTALVNPSYFTPYAYRMFAQVTPEHNWTGVVDTSYEILQKSIHDPLDNTQTAEIPPDWIFIDKSMGNIKPANTGDLSSNFSYDAMRIPFRITLDYIWYAEPRAKQILESMTFLSQEWENKKALYTSYSHNGQPLTAQEAPAIYGGTLGYFMVQNPQLADAVYINKLQVLYNPDTNSWKEHLGYYDANWAWFGLALYNNRLENLAQNLK